MRRLKKQYRFRLLLCQKKEATFRGDRITNIMNRGGPPSPVGFRRRSLNYGGQIGRASPDKSGQAKNAVSPALSSRNSLLRQEERGELN